MKPTLISTLLLTTIAGGLISSVQAGEPDFINPISYQAPVPDDKWEFIIAPQLWMTGLDGQVGIGGAIADVDASFGDILDALDFAVFLTAEARKGRFGFQIDGFWVSLSGDGDTPDLRFRKADLEVDEYRVAPMVSYRVLEGQTDVDLMAGAQYFRVETDLKLTGGLRPDVRVSDTEDWVDPMVALRIHHEFSEKWVAFARADIGGFGVNSDFIWQLFGAVGYRWTPTTTVVLGYRYLDIDYESGDFTYDAAMSGFVIGARFTF